MVWLMVVDGVVDGIWKVVDGGWWWLMVVDGVVDGMVDFIVVDFSITLKFNAKY